MIKREYIFIFFVLLFLTSCASYYKLKPKHFEDQNLLKEQWLDITEFDVYTFNICESYKEHINPANRFAKCSKKFFDISAKDSIKKVEELYLLVHKTSDVVMYMTTFSHRYIAKQKGFLNDAILYREKFYLRDTEYIYIGRNNNDDLSIQFERQKKKIIDKENLKPNRGKEIILHYKEFMRSINKIEVEKVNVETVENTGNFDEKIPLKKVFSVPLEFNRSNYTLYGTKKKNDTKEIAQVCFKKNLKGYYDVVFKIKDSRQGYLFPAKKVLYFTE